VARTLSSSLKSSLLSIPGSLSGTVFDIELVDSRPGVLVFRVIGNRAQSVFQNEPGGHRWQRIPPTEKRGRVQTSTITVAVLPEPTETEVSVRLSDLEWTTCRGSGPGGQHRNKTESAVQVKHIPSGIFVRCETERSQQQNKNTAMATLKARLWQIQKDIHMGQRVSDRKAQVGSGMRGDKRRTIRCQDGVVTDHLTGKRWRLKEYMRGEW
jgi:peptide chain release factor 1